MPRFAKSTTPEAVLIRRNLARRASTMQVRAFVRRMVQVTPKTVEEYRRLGKDLVLT